MFLNSELNFLQKVALLVMGISAFVMYGRDMVTVSISSVGWRQEGLSKVIKTFLPQADKINVFLQGYKLIPSFLNNDKITVVTGEEYPQVLILGACAKFFWAQDIKGYHIVIDDDIIYPDDYVNFCVQKIEQYKRVVVIGFHGVTFPKDMKAWRQKKMYHFSGELPSDVYVNVLGTGTIAYHSDTLKVSFADFPVRNRVDAYFALIAQKQNIPFICVQRKKFYLKSDLELGAAAAAVFKETSYEIEMVKFIQEHSLWNTVMNTEVVPSKD